MLLTFRGNYSGDLPKILITVLLKVCEDKLHKFRLKIRLGKSPEASFS